MSNSNALGDVKRYFLHTENVELPKTCQQFYNKCNEHNKSHFVYPSYCSICKDDLFCKTEEKCKSCEFENYLKEPLNCNRLRSDHLLEECADNIDEKKSRIRNHIAMSDYLANCNGSLHKNNDCCIYTSSCDQLKPRVDLHFFNPSPKKLTPPNHRSETRNHSNGIHPTFSTSGIQIENIHTHYTYRYPNQKCSEDCNGTIEIKETYISGSPPRSNGYLNGYSVRNNSAPSPKTNHSDSSISPKQLNGYVNKSNNLEQNGYDYYAQNVAALKSKVSQLKEIIDTNYMSKSTQIDINLPENDKLKDRQEKLVRPNTIEIRNGDSDFHIIKESECVENDAKRQRIRSSNDEVKVKIINATPKPELLPVNEAYIKSVDSLGTESSLSSSENSLNLKKNGSSSSVSDCEDSLKTEPESEDELQYYDEATNVLAEPPASLEGVSNQWPFRHSLFPFVPPYVRFSSHDTPGHKIPPLFQRQLKWKLSTITPVVVRKTVMNSGFRLMRKSTDWAGIWGKHMKSPQFRGLREHQKINHFPGTFQLGRKDRLWRNMQKLQMRNGTKGLDFIPRTYVLPQDLRILRNAFEKSAGMERWIIKPPASARGTGIRVVHKWTQIPKKKSVVVQRYIAQPYLINGSKFDLRLYVLVTSVDPLRVYLYSDGLVRFASVKYSDDFNTLHERYMHLTNYSINKLSSQYTANEDANACQGHKWTLQKLWEYLGARGIDTAALWSELSDLVIKTIICGESGITQLARANVGSRYNCYELFGIDVLLDQNLKPWLLEVNISPSLHSSSPLDLHVKGPLVQSLLNMAQYHVPHSFRVNSAQHEQLVRSLGLDRPDVEPSEIPLTFDTRLYSTTLSKKEKAKHVQFVQFTDRTDYLDDILETLMPDDVRKLVLAEDELQVIGDFQRIFPTPNSHHYLNLMETRYYDRLFDAWENKYGHNRALGIRLLQTLCEKKYHLIVPSLSMVKNPLEKEHQTSEMIQEEQNEQQNSQDSINPTTLKPSRRARTVLFRAARIRCARRAGVVVKPFPRCSYLTRALEQSS